MSVAVVANSRDNPLPLAAWASNVAKMLQQDVVLICPLSKSGYDSSIEIRCEESLPSELTEWLNTFRQFGLTLAADLSEEPASSDAEESDASSTLQNSLQLFAGPTDHWADWALRILKRENVQLVILPRVADTRLNDRSFDQQRMLLAEATCEVLQIRCSETTPQDCRRILVPAGSGSQSVRAIRWAADLANGLGAELTGVYVEPNVDAYAESVGESILDRHLRAGIGDEADNVERSILLGDNVAREIVAIANEFDLIVLGVRYQGVVRRWLGQGISEDLITAKSRCCVMSIRMPIPLASRIAKSIDTTFRNGVPQLTRPQRVRLVERIQSSSRWDIDFIALICLSTLIATGGLLQSSTAVVIGAMLVAPLMTPLLGAGLSLVQGNPILLRNTIRTVFRGFLLAMAVAFLIGLLVRLRVPTEVLVSRVTSEMLARGAPGILDLLVAFISGIAAAYAIGRPNLLSALPGVAIAAALVPPVSTLGLAAAWGQYHLALGSGLLFLTNIVAIVLGTACSFWAVGIRNLPGRSFLNTPTWRTAVALIIILIGLGVYETNPTQRIPDALRSDLLQLVNSSPHLDAADVEWRSPDAKQLIVHVHSPRPLDHSIQSGIATIVFRHLKPDTIVELRTHLATTFDQRVRSNRSSAEPTLRPAVDKDN